MKRNKQLNNLNNFVSKFNSKNKKDKVKNLQNSENNKKAHFKVKRVISKSYKKKNANLIMSIKVKQTQ